MRGLDIIPVHAQSLQLRLALAMTSNYFRHLDGGLYRFVAKARDADTTEAVVVYEHLWPFEPGLWVRQEQAFFDRFKPIDAQVCANIMLGDRDAAQLAVSEAKARRRAAKPDS